jgi:hypothetical protein
VASAELGAAVAPGVARGVGAGVVRETSPLCGASTATAAGVFARRAALGLQTSRDCEPRSPSTHSLRSGSASPHQCFDFASGAERSDCDCLLAPPRGGSGRRELVAPVTAVWLNGCEWSVEAERRRAARGRAPAGTRSPERPGRSRRCVSEPDRGGGSSAPSAREGRRWPSGGLGAGSRGRPLRSSAVALLTRYLSLLSREPFPGARSLFPVVLPCPSWGLLLNCDVHGSGVDETTLGSVRQGELGGFWKERERRSAAANGLSEPNRLRYLVGIRLRPGWAQRVAGRFRDGGCSRRGASSRPGAMPGVGASGGWLLDEPGGAPRLVNAFIRD